MNSFRIILIRVLRDWDIYLTLFISLVIGVLGGFGIVEATIVSSAVLATLFLISTSLLFNRHEANQTQGQLADLVTRIRINPREFKNHEDCHDEMKRFITRSSENRQITSIRVIGVAMRFSWPFLEMEIPTLLNSKKAEGKLILEFALLNIHWAPLKEFEDWHQKTTHTDELIDTFKKKNQHYIDNGKLTINVYHYSHFPIQHGMLINDEALFRSHCEWKKAQGGQGFELTVGENRYELYEQSDWDGPEKIEQFKSLFEYYRTTSEEGKREQTI